MRTQSPRCRRASAARLHAKRIRRRSSSVLFTPIVYPDQTPLDGERHRVGAVFGTELLADQLQVVLYRPLGQVDGPSYLLGFVPGSDQAQDLGLSLR